jgi:hypothetical protein
MRNSKVVKKMENLLDPYFQRQQTAVVDVYRILINTYMETEHDEFHLVIERFFFVGAFSQLDDLKQRVALTMPNSLDEMHDLVNLHASQILADVGDI